MVIFGIIKYRMYVFLFGILLFGFLGMEGTAVLAEGVGVARGLRGRGW